MVYDVALNGTQARFDVSVHRVGEEIIMEFEPAASLEGTATDIAHVRNAIDQLTGLATIDAVCARAVRFVKMITGFDFALLDINLGTETSYDIARNLASADIPFAFAAGYGDGSVIPDDLQDRLTLAKPCGRDAIIQLVARVLGA